MAYIFMSIFLYQLDNVQGVAEMVLDRLAKSLRVDYVTDTSKETQLIKRFVRKQHRASKILLISDPKTEAPTY